MGTKNRRYEKENNKRLREIEKEIRDQMNFGMQEWGYNLFSKSVDMTPIDTGRLREESTLKTLNNVIISKGEQDVGNMTFSEDKKPVKKMGLVIEYPTKYAIYQHEDLTFNHPRGGNAKFLELAVMEYTPKLKKYIYNYKAGDK